MATPTPMHASGSHVITRMLLRGPAAVTARSPASSACSSRSTPIPSRTGASGAPSWWARRQPETTARASAGRIPAPITSASAGTPVAPHAIPAAVQGTLQARLDRLDPETRESFYKLVFEMNRERKATVLLVTHDRRMLDTVRLTRRWHVEDGQVTEITPD